MKTKFKIADNGRINIKLQWWWNFIDDLIANYKWVWFDEPGLVAILEEIDAHIITAKQNPKIKWVKFNSKNELIAFKLRWSD